MLQQIFSAAKIRLEKTPSKRKQNLKIQTCPFLGIWRLRLYQGKRLNVADFGMTLNVQKLQENQGELKAIFKL